MSLQSPIRLYKQKNGRKNHQIFGLIDISLSTLFPRKLSKDKMGLVNPQILPSSISFVNRQTDKWTFILLEFWEMASGIHLPKWKGYLWAFGLSVKLLYLRSPLYDWKIPGHIVQQQQCIKVVLDNIKLLLLFLILK